MLAGVGAVAVHGEERYRAHPVVATTYGSGLALIVDEFALLLDLKDVYWAPSYSPTSPPASSLITSSWPRCRAYS